MILKKLVLEKQKKHQKYHFKSTPIFYDGYPFEMVVYGFAKFYSFKNQLSIGLELNTEKRDYFEKIEKRISDLYGKKLHLIKTRGYGKYYSARVYAKLSQNKNVGIFFDDTKIIKNPFDYVNIPCYARIVMKISRICDGNCLSIICEANEVIVQ